MESGMAGGSVGIARAAKSEMDFIPRAVKRVTGKAGIPMASSTICINTEPVLDKVNGLGGHRMVDSMPKDSMITI